MKTITIILILVVLGSICVGLYWWNVRVNRLKHVDSAFQTVVLPFSNFDDYEKCCERMEKIIQDGNLAEVEKYFKDHPFVCNYEQGNLGETLSGRGNSFYHANTTSALALVAKYNQVEMAKFLINNGADINNGIKSVKAWVHHSTGEEFSPLAIAEGSGHKEMIEFLRSKGALSIFHPYEMID